jgi:hypothetical protein
MRIGEPIRCSPDSRTKSPQELIRESNLVGTPNADSFFSFESPQESMIRFILYHYFSLSQIDGNKFLVSLG